MQSVFRDETAKRHGLAHGYVCYRLRHDVPIVNFIVLDFGSGRDQEIYFGFGRHPHDETGTVFYSTDKELVQLFRNVHDTLRSEKLSFPHRVELEAIEDQGMYGVWRSEAVIDGTLLDIAFVTITAGDTGVSIRGKIVDLYGEERGWFRSENVMLSNDKLIFLYRRDSIEQMTINVEALGIYYFGDKVSFVGELIDIGKVEKVKVRGFRATGDEKQMVINNEWDKVPELIKRALAGRYHIGGAQHGRPISGEAA